MPEGLGNLPETLGHLPEDLGHVPEAFGNLPKGFGQVIIRYYKQTVRTWGCSLLYQGEFGSAENKKGRLTHTESAALSSIHQYTNNQ